MTMQINYIVEQTASGWWWYCLHVNGKHGHWQHAYASRLVAEAAAKRAVKRLTAKNQVKEHRKHG